MDDWKKKAVGFFIKIQREIKNSIPIKAKVKDIIWDDEGIVEIVYEY